MALKFCGRKLLLARNCIRNNVRHQGYIVLIPEIGEDLPEINPLLQQNGLPEFNNITIENCMAAIGKQTLEFENDIKELEGKISKNEAKDIFRDVIDTLEIQGNSLDMTWGLSKTLYLGHSTKMPTKNYLAIHERAKRARAAKYNSKIIYEEVVKELGANRNEEQSRILKKFALEGKLNGLSLSDKQRERLIEALNKLNKERGEFKVKIENSTSRFTHLVEDPKIVEEMPPKILQTISNNNKDVSGPWKVTLQRQVAIPFMEYCPDRMLRWNIWQGMVGRGSGYSKREFETSTNLEKIRALRHDEAKLLGYENYAEMSMETKMAGNVANVNKMIENLLESAYPAQKAELDNLLKFAVDNGFEGNKIELWDLPYWRRKQKNTIPYINENLSEYFPFKNVINALFEMSQELFGIEIKARQENVSVWHKNVQFFDVYENNQKIGGFYLDPYIIDGLNKNSEHGFFIGIQNKSVISNTKPLAALVFNFNQNEAFLNFDQVKLVFNKFGQALQHLLTHTNYSEVSGLSNIEWDAVEVPGLVLSNLLLDKRVLCKINPKIPEEIHESLLKSHQHLTGVNLCRELYLSKLDLTLYSTRDFWLDVVKNLWPQFRCFSLDKLDSHPCSFTQIFTEEYSAAYYCHIWSKLVAADVTGAFLEAKNDDFLKNVGKRFRETFLLFGGSCHSSEVFRKFRGRDPSPKALLRSLGLKKEGGEKENS